MKYTLKNKKLTVIFESKGATLHSIKDNEEWSISGKEIQNTGPVRHQSYSQSVEVSE